MSARDLSRGARAPVLLLALLCLATGGLAGSQWRDATSRTPSYLAQLTDSLGLRPDQVAALDSVLEAEDVAIDALLKAKLDELNGPVAERRRRTEDELLALLDAPQRARYEQLLQAGSTDGERGR
jgi:hypothetical protein